MKLFILAALVAAAAAAAGGNYTIVYKNETSSCLKSGMMPKNNTGSVKTNSSLTLEGCEQVSGSARPGSTQTRISFKVLVDVTHAHGMHHYYVSLAYPLSLFSL